MQDSDLHKIVKGILEERQRHYHARYISAQEKGEEKHISSIATAPTLHSHKLTRSSEKLTKDDLGLTNIDMKEVPKRSKWCCWR